MTSNAPNNSGTIAGIVVGVFVFLAVIGLSLLWFLRRRRQARIAPSTAYLAEIGRHRKGPPECQRKRLIAEDQDYLAEPVSVPTLNSSRGLADINGVWRSSRIRIVSLLLSPKEHLSHSLLLDILADS